MRCCEIIKHTYNVYIYIFKCSKYDHVTERRSMIRSSRSNAIIRWSVCWTTWVSLEIPLFVLRKWWSAWEAKGWLGGSTLKPHIATYSTFGTLWDLDNWKLRWLTLPRLSHLVFEGYGMIWIDIEEFKHDGLWRMGLWGPWFDFLDDMVIRISTWRHGFGRLRFCGWSAEPDRPGRAHVVIGAVRGTEQNRCQHLQICRFDCLCRLSQPNPHALSRTFTYSKDLRYAAQRWLKVLVEE